MDSRSKLQTLETEAITNKKGSKWPKTPPHSHTNPIHKCSVSAHLRYILEEKEDNKNKIKALQGKRDELYSAIRQNLAQEEPYLHGKILKKVERQVKKEVALEAIKELQRVCKSKENWLA
jgi:hypothetical protein